MKIEQGGKIQYDFSVLEKLMKSLKSKYYVDVGILGEASYEEGATIAGIGAVHEFGRLDGSIPERSLIRMPIQKKQKEIAKKIEPKFKEYISKNDIKGIFTLLGVECEGIIQEAFDTGGFGIWPDIEDETERRKGSDRILIDMGALRRAITSKVGVG